MRDPHTQDPRGFAFVTMETEPEANAAIDNLNATEFFNRTITVAKVQSALVPFVIVISH
jgi:RNA recognition motif-containing protein